MGDAEKAGHHQDRQDAVAALRAAALHRLREAGASRDARRFERLAWSALDLLDRARALSAAPSGGPRPVPTDKEEFPVSRKLAAEFLGTLWLVLGGCGSAVLAAKFPEVGIGLVGVSFAFGLTVLTMAYAVGHISGCHLNPAVTVGLVAAGRFKASAAPGYIAAQVLGAVAGAAVLFATASGKAGFDPSAGFSRAGGRNTGAGDRFSGPPRARPEDRRRPGPAPQPAGDRPRGKAGPGPGLRRPWRGTAATAAGRTAEDAVAFASRRRSRPPSRAAEGGQPFSSPSEPPNTGRAGRARKKAPGAAPPRPAARHRRSAASGPGAQARPRATSATPA